MSSNSGEKCDGYCGNGGRCVRGVCECPDGYTTDLNGYCQERPEERARVINGNEVIDNQGMGTEAAVGQAQDGYLVNYVNTSSNSLLSSSATTSTTKSSKRTILSNSATTPGSNFHKHSNRVSRHNHFHKRNSRNILYAQFLLLRRSRLCKWSLRMQTRLQDVGKVSFSRLRHCTPSLLVNAK